MLSLSHFLYSPSFSLFLLKEAILKVGHLLHDKRSTKALHKVEKYPGI
jgi:hypothetical protein